MRPINIITAILLILGVAQIAWGEEAKGTERFQAVGKNIVYDSQTELMWAVRDNGKDVDWYDADNYCKDFEAGGYSDWRLPDVKELATLYTKGTKNKDGYFIIDLIKITDCCMWSADTNMGGAEIFSFKSGKKPVGFLADTYQLRALPVRTNKKMNAGEYDVVDIRAKIK